MELQQLYLIICSELFVLIFTEKKVLLRKKWFYILLFGTPLALIIRQWTTGNLLSYVKRDFGHGLLWQ